MKFPAWQPRLLSALSLVAIATTIGIAAPSTSVAALSEPSDTVWTPLSASEYFHVYSTTFVPSIEPVAGDSESAIRRTFGNFSPQATETWLATDGHGTNVNIFGGGGDPTEFPRLYPDSTGRINGYGGTVSGTVDPSMYAASLRYPDGLTSTSWPRGETLHYRHWYRVPGGFRLGSSGNVGTLPGPGTTLAERRQHSTWGATNSRLDTINAASGAELDAAIARMVAVSPTSLKPYPAPGRYGVTLASAAEEANVALAVRLLGNAPLSASARAAIFRWISTRPSARRWTGVLDERGRGGTRVTLQTVRNVPIPARTVTLAQLRRQGGFRADAVVAGKPSYFIPAHHEFRRWNVMIVFDTQSDELLQQSLYARWETDAMLPRIQRYGRGQLRVALAMDRQAMFDAAVYDARERTTIQSPVAAACVDFPGVCR